MISENAAALSVSELNEYARKLLAGDVLLRNVEVTGEISGYKHHYSGHRYFSLKDDSARVQCVMFRQQAMNLDFKPEDGMQVTVRASASIFPRDGSYQLYINTMKKAGKGDLFAQFEKLKQKLASEGLFDPARKKEIPFFPSTIGIVTSETGAAVRDMIRVARRRNPNVGIILAPCAVQGAAAAGEIVRAIEKLNQNGECDVLLVGRGGGSIEDLWAFNEEVVARAIAASRIPVISCVGHEIDFTIADFVADLRAATPSAAAELAVPVLSDLQAGFDHLLIRMAKALDHGLRIRKMRFEQLCSANVMVYPAKMMIDARRSALDEVEKRLKKALMSAYEKHAQRLNSAEISLRALNPSSILDRGYAVIEGPGGFIVHSAAMTPGMNINIKMSDGCTKAIVSDIHPEESEYEKENQL